MDANRKYPEARGLTYGEFPSMFVWNKRSREWTKRKKGFAIGRLQFIHPGSGQLYYMRTLLNHIRGAKYTILLLCRLILKPNPPKSQTQPLFPIK